MQLILRLTIAVVIMLLSAARAAAYNPCLHASADQILQKASPYTKSIAASARNYQLDAHLIRAVIAIESCYNRHAVSAKGAQGLMQLMPETAERFGIADSFNSSQNIKGGALYLRFLKQRYNNDLQKILAAYNAGEGAVDQYQGIPPYAETETYVKHVIKAYRKLRPHDPRIFLATGQISKPGRSGIADLKARAPHLFRK